jgi:hypothetical protein
MDNQSDPHRWWVAQRRNYNVGAPRRIRTATARILSPSPLPVGLVEQNGATGADRTRGLVLTKNALSRLSYGGDGAREGGRLPGLRVTRAALYAELRGHDWWRRRGSNFRSWLYKNPALPLGYAGKKIHKRPGPTRPKHSLPETTVCRPTEGDQYRISGPSYVLAGTAILNSKNVSRHHATSQRSRFSAG